MEEVDKSDQVKLREAYLALPAKTRKKLHKEYRKRNGLQESTFVRAFPKVGRNAPCVCGSNRKYKNCCYGNLNDCYVEVKHGISEDKI